ncbi:hypothetical protein [Kordia sp.]|uniref:hypothetical protein n=1 Tax=Kordia sp. TaxID=1965332 RepID=UPI0025C0E61D|nr:hypothetical protein [Kordia sp.]MCH2195829.1 hypothetical protein [Kordia sp.]
MTPAVIGKDSLWLITEIDDLISKVGGYYLYATPFVLKYTKNDDGYAIELELEAQLAEVDSQVTKIDGDVISFL